MKKIGMSMPKPEEWAQAAALGGGGWLHAYGIARRCAKDMLGKDADVKNPHAPYWKRAKLWIEKNAPEGALEEKNPQTEVAQ